MGKKLNIPIQICYLGLAGFMVVASLFSLLRGNISYFLEGIVLLAAALFFALFTAREKLVFGGNLTPISDSLVNVVTGNPITAFFSTIDDKLAWIYIALSAYFDLNISMIISRIPVISLVDSVISSVSYVFYYVFIIALISLFAKKQYNRIAALTGAYTAIMVCGFAIDFVRGIFSSSTYLFYSNFVPILIFGYLFALFNEYMGMEKSDVGNQLS